MPPLPKRVPADRAAVRDFMRGPGQFSCGSVGLTGLWVAGARCPRRSSSGSSRRPRWPTRSARRPARGRARGRGGRGQARGSVARLDSGPLEAQLSVAEQQLAAVLADVTALAASQALAAAERLLAIGESDAELVQDGQANRSRVRDEVWRLQIEARERRLAILALEVEIERDLLKADQVVQRRSPCWDSDAREARTSNWRRIWSGRQPRAPRPEGEGRVASVASLDVAWHPRGPQAPRLPGGERGSAAPARAADDAAITAPARVAIRRPGYCASSRRKTLSATIAGRVGLLESRPRQALLAGGTVALVESAAANARCSCPSPPRPRATRPRSSCSPAGTTCGGRRGGRRYGRASRGTPAPLAAALVPEFGRTLIVRAVRSGSSRRGARRPARGPDGPGPPSAGAVRAPRCAGPIAGSRGRRPVGRGRMRLRAWAHGASVDVAARIGGGSVRSSLPPGPAASLTCSIEGHLIDPPSSEPWAWSPSSVERDARITGQQNSDPFTCQGPRYVGGMNRCRCGGRRSHPGAEEPAGSNALPRHSCRGDLGPALPRAPRALAVVEALGVNAEQLPLTNARGPRDRLGCRVVHGLGGTDPLGDLSPSVVGLEEEPPLPARRGGQTTVPHIGDEETDVPRSGEVDLPVPSGMVEVELEARLRGGSARGGCGDDRGGTIFEAHVLRVDVRATTNTGKGMCSGHGLPSKRGTWGPPSVCQ